ncbi:hypothetical protein BDN72DRAFT_864891 [Pluteus cervinus]|uniref:Uncharacterized protein n=1 Tax=Pluteus cervinus TaxID=181527 RepID=A0ACD3A285_9AGAR|nr:hypothetical protein BDN72DRAFT_864891 [Pluteus cervinus]
MFADSVGSSADCKASAGCRMTAGYLHPLPAVGVAYLRDVEERPAEAVGGDKRNELARTAVLVVVMVVERTLRLSVLALTISRRSVLHVSTTYHQRLETLATPKAAGNVLAATAKAPTTTPLGFSASASIPCDFTHWYSPTALPSLRVYPFDQGRRIHLFIYCKCSPSKVPPLFDVEVAQVRVEVRRLRVKLGVQGGKPSVEPLDARINLQKILVSPALVEMVARDVDCKKEVKKAEEKRLHELVVNGFGGRGLSFGGDEAVWDEERGMWNGWGQRAKSPSVWACKVAELIPLSLSLFISLLLIMVAIDFLKPVFGERTKWDGMCTGDGISGDAYDIDVVVIREGDDNDDGDARGRCESLDVRGCRKTNKSCLLHVPVNSSHKLGHGGRWEVSNGMSAAVCVSFQSVQLGMGLLQLERAMTEDGTGGMMALKRQLQQFPLGFFLAPLGGFYSLANRSGAAKWHMQNDPPDQMSPSWGYLASWRGYLVERWLGCGGVVRVD